MEGRGEQGLAGTHASTLEPPAWRAHVSSFVTLVLWVLSRARDVILESTVHTWPRRWVPGAGLGQGDKAAASHVHPWQSAGAKPTASLLPSRSPTRGSCTLAPVEKGTLGNVVQLNPKVALVPFCQPASPSATLKGGMKKEHVSPCVAERQAATPPQQGL